MRPTKIRIGLIVALLLLLPDGRTRAGGLLEQARSCRCAGRYAEATTAAKAALAVLRQRKDAPPPELTACLNSLAEIYQLQGLYADGEPLALEALRIGRAQTPPASASVARSLNVLGCLHRDRGEAREAEQYFQDALQIRRKELPENHPDIATTLNDLGELHVSQGLADSAKAHFTQALNIRRAALPPAHPETAASLADLGVLYYTQGDMARAEPSFREALAMQRKTLPALHPDIACTLANLAELHRSRGEFKLAEASYLEALRIRRASLPAGHPDIATNLDNLAGYYQQQANYSKAEPLFREALALRKKTLPPTHQDIALSLNNLAGFYQVLGDLNQAKAYFGQALEIWRAALPAQHPGLALALNNLGGVYMLQAQFEKAEPLYQEALKIRQASLPPTHLSITVSLNNLAQLNAEQGRFRKAESLYLQSLEIKRKSLVAGSPEIAEGLNNLAALYRDHGEDQKAEPLYQEALAIFRRAYSAHHPNVATSLNNLALFYRGRGDYARAQPLAEEAVAILRKALPEGHPDLANSVRNLGLFYDDQGDGAKAEPLYLEALATQRKALPEGHPMIARTLSNLAALYLLQGAGAKATAPASEALATIKHHLDRVATIESEAQQLAMVRLYSWVLHTYLGVAVGLRLPAAEVYAQVLPWKGAILVRQQAYRAAARSNPGLAPLLLELRDVAFRLSTLSSGLREGSNPAAWRAELKSLADRREELEARLARDSQEYRARKAILALSPETLTHALPAGTALVDLLEYEIRNSAPPHTAVRQLMAFVLRPDKAVQMIPLGEAHPTAVAVEQWRASSGGSPAARDAGRLLRSRVWEPLVPSLAGVKTVLLSPDGALSSFPWAALPGSAKDSYLLEEGVALAVIPVPRLLPALLSRHPAAPAPGLLLVGNVDFDAGGPPLHAPWIPLPSTRFEIEAIQKLFHENFQQSALETLEGSKARTAAVVKRAPHFEYLHLATHGFYTGSQTGAELAGRHLLAESDPGLLSGLVLAGGNHPKPEDDGVLSATAVSELDLTRAKLVVLSACETGLGKLASGEGVLGLQRALQIAGARTAVTSLWKVPDAATQSLMTHFYQNLWVRKLPVIEALRAAQLAVLNGSLEKPGIARALIPVSAPEPVENRRASPYYWAAFVLSGDWR
jgi:CHAT domain-containing protein/tetratricopeptide (TPR) repeat protein